MARYRWAQWGDVNAFFGLMLDNVAVLVLMASYLVGIGFPPELVLGKMVPGTALGVLFGDLVYTWMAFRLARRTGRDDVTAMPLGLDTPSTFGMVLFVLGPAFTTAKEAHLSSEEAARVAWLVGVNMLLLSGVFKIGCAFVSGLVRRFVPRAGLLGSLAAVALVLIAFFPLLDIVAVPLVGFVSLGLVLVTLVARTQMPWRLPGALVVVVAGTLLYHLLAPFALVPPVEWEGTLSLRMALPIPTLAWVEHFRLSLAYLPVVLPFALMTVVGGIDCTESAAAAGDEYHTGRIVFVEGLATLVGGLCGGVVQSTPYIGHPAYKAMGGRAAYTLATALFVAAAAMFGFFGLLFILVPKAVLFPILIFVGLEITAQSYSACPRRHYPALAIACLPAVAYLCTLFTDRLLNATRTALADLNDMHLMRELITLRILAGGGRFIITSLLWASALAEMIDQRFRRAAAYLLVAAVCSLFGVIHSPLSPGVLALPSEVVARLPEAARWQTPYHMAWAYVLMAVVLTGLSYLRQAGPSARAASSDVAE